MMAHGLQTGQTDRVSFTQEPLTCWPAKHGRPWTPALLADSSQAFLVSAYPVAEGGPAGPHGVRRGRAETGSRNWPLRNATVELSLAGRFSGTASARPASRYSAPSRRRIAGTGTT